MEEEERTYYQVLVDAVQHRPGTGEEHKALADNQTAPIATTVNTGALRIGDIEGMVSRAQIIDPLTLSGDRIVFGATVTLLDENDKPVRYQIVGQTEADATRGRISYNSPLGKALIGKKVGEDVEVTVPSGEKFYLVEKIEFI